MGFNTLAWRRVNIEEAGRRFTVFAPNGNFSLNEVPQIMEDITTHVKSVNRNCPIFLVLPAIKDMYQFNQKRLVQNLRENNRNTQPQLASQERIQGLPSEHIAPSVSIPSREETSHEQPPELPPSNNIILQPVPWVPSSVIGSDHEDETERANPSIHRQIAPLSVNIPVLLGTRPLNNVSQSTTANQPNSLQGLPPSFLQEETPNLSPIVQRTIEEGIDNLVISTVSRNHTRHDRINVLQGIMAITNYKLQQLRN
ncbi:UNVERIFIED_CONTAM: hypothetical protein RMT77_002421 [Armadillidium vulgare]